MDDVNRFLACINYQNTDIFDGVEIEKVVLKKNDESFTVYLSSDKVVDLAAYEEMLNCAKKGIHGEKKCKVIINYTSLTNEDKLAAFKYVLNKLIAKKPSLESLMSGNISIDEDVVVVEVASKVEEELVNEYAGNLSKALENLGFPNINITSLFNQEKNAIIKKEITAVHDGEKVAPKEDNPVFIGKQIDGEITKINDILGEAKNVIVEAYIFGELTTLEKETINIITMKISDKSNSLLAKIFKRDHDEFSEVMSKLKAGKWYRIHGNVEFDTFAKEIVLAVRNMESIKSKDIPPVDDEEVKRVELHAHTMMSMMDSVVGLDLEKHTCALVDYAISMGHRGVAITDHNGCQAFPIAFENITKHNKGLEDKDKFKGLYGTELNVVNDDVNVVFNINENNYDLIEDEFVVFDTETTGFYFGHDQMIEIGAVKIKNGEILDRFDELINPGRALPKKITELTNITDEMLSDKDTEENVTKRFLEWAGNDPMVAHNAKFDIGFMNAACKKYNLGEFKATVVDTMSVARMIYPEWPNHKLSTLVKKLNVPWNEDEHHRGDYDAEGTAKCFYNMCKTLSIIIILIGAKGVWAKSDDPFTSINQVTKFVLSCM